MKIRTTLLTLGFLAVMCLVPSELAALELAEGIWQGSRTSANDSSLNVYVEWRVSKTEGDSAPGVVLVHVLGSAPLRDLRIEDGKLHYWFIVPGRGNRADCDLELQEDGRYQGTCTTTGASFFYTFSPPRG